MLIFSDIFDPFNHRWKHLHNFFIGIAVYVHEKKEQEESNSRTDVFETG